MADVYVEEMRFGRHSVGILSDNAVPNSGHRTILIDGVVALSDFKNATYSILNASKNLSDLWVDAGFGSPPVVTPGVGFSNTGTAAFTAYFGATPALISAVGGGGAPLCFVVEYNVSSTGTNDGHIGVGADSFPPVATTGWFFDGNADSGGATIKLSDYGVIGPTQVTTAGARKVAVILENDVLAASVNGAAPLVSGNPQDNVWVELLCFIENQAGAGTALATIEKITFYTPRGVGDLQGMST